MLSIVKRGQNLVKTLFGTYYILRDKFDFFSWIKTYEIKKGHPSLLWMTLLRGRKDGSTFKIVDESLVLCLGNFTLGITCLGNR